MNIYEDIGLDEYLKPINTPLQYGGTISPFDFDSMFNRDSINTNLLRNDSVSNAKIESLNANKITAGTIDASQISVVNLSASNITSGTLSANYITGGTMSANYIGGGTMSANYLSSGTINASNIAVINIDADKITTGEINCNNVRIENLDGVTNSAGSTVINGGKITTGTIDASQVTVDNIDASNISAGTITGIKLRSASSGERIEVGSGSQINIYDASSQRGGIYATNAEFYILAQNNANLWLASNGGNVNINETLDMYGNKIQGIDAALFDENSSRPSDSDCIWYYKDGASYGFRSRMEGGNWSFDQTSI